MIVGRIEFQEFAVPPGQLRLYVRVCGMGLGHLAQRGPQLHDTLGGALRINELGSGSGRRLIYEELVAILAHMKRQQVSLGNGGIFP